MKIFLANPPTHDQSRFTREGRCQQAEGVWTTVWPPLSLAQSAAVLRESGFHVFAADAPTQGWDMQEFLDHVKSIDPRLIVLATSTPSFAQDIDTIKQIRHTLPDVIIAAIGIHVSTLPDESFAVAPELDVIVRGEPEISLKELAESLKTQNRLTPLPGLSIRLNGTIEHSPDRPYIGNLDTLPIPAWDLFPVNQYVLPFEERPFLLVTTARGCPYQCTFCVAKSYYGQQVRHRSPDRIVDEIRTIVDKFAIRDFFFWSESTTLGRESMMELCRKVKNLNPSVRWVCNSRVDHVDDELLETMREAGCWMLSFGIESGNQKILDQSQKKQTLDQTRKAVALARKHRFQIAGHFVLGLPGETHDTLEETRKFALSLDLDYAQFYCAAPWPGSDLYQEAISEGWIKTNNWADYDQSTAVLNYPHLSAQEIQDFRDRAVRSFYLRPRLIARTLSRLRKPSEALKFVRAVRRYLTWI